MRKSLRELLQSITWLYACSSVPAARTVVSMSGRSLTKAEFAVRVATRVFGELVVEGTKTRSRRGVARMFREV